MYSLKNTQISAFKRKPRRLVLRLLSVSVVLLALLWGSVATLTLAASSDLTVEPSSNKATLSLDQESTHNNEVGTAMLQITSAFTLQILHASDLEGGVDAIANAPNFAAIVEALETQAITDGISSTLVSAGDNYLPGPFFSAAGDQATFRDGGVFNDAYNELFGLVTPTVYNSLREGGGRVDISIMNILGMDATAIGNHEFDLGPTTFFDLMNPDFRDPAGPDSDRWVGTQFPYLSANLDFSNDGDLNSVFTDTILVNTAFGTGPDESTAGTTGVPKVAPATFIEAGGEQIGVVGGTTPRLEQISSPGDVTVKNPGAGTNDMDALASILQPVIDDVRDGADDTLGTGDDIDKVILTTHLQQISLEQELATKLSGVDVIIAGGSDTILADSQDVLRTGDTAIDTYPLVATDLDGNPTLIVSTDGEYKYVGRLVVGFDDSGVVVTDSLDINVSGVFSTTDEGVTALWGNLTDPFTDTTKGAQVKRLTDAVQGVVIAKDSQISGKTEVFLEGRREKVRTEETNLGNLTADSMLAAAQEISPSVAVAIKNGGGIRAQIGEVDKDGNLLPPQENPLSGKQTGEISQLDIENSLRFDNSLSILTLTAEELERIIEHGVAASGPGNTPGQFPQVGGLRFEYDVSQQPIVFSGTTGIVLTDGERIRSLEITGSMSDTIVSNGQLVGDTDREIQVVTLGFLAGGGDSYPFDVYGENVIDTGLGEQAVLSDYLTSNFTPTAYMIAETPPEEDTRIIPTSSGSIYLPAIFKN